MKFEPGKQRSKKTNSTSSDKTSCSLCVEILYAWILASSLPFCERKLDQVEFKDYCVCQNISQM